MWFVFLPLKCLRPRNSQPVSLPGFQMLNRTGVFLVLKSREQGLAREEGAERGCAQAQAHGATGPATELQRFISSAPLPLLPPNNTHSSASLPS